MDIIMDVLKLKLQRDMLKFHVGQVIFCPGCNTIMDCKRAVEVDFYKGDDLVKSKVVCATCYDSRLKGKLDSIPDIRVDPIDGRVLFARPKRTKRAMQEVHAV